MLSRLDREAVAGSLGFRVYIEVKGYLAVLVGLSPNTFSQKPALKTLHPKTLTAQVCLRDASGVLSLMVQLQRCSKTLDRFKVSVNGFLNDCHGPLVS